VAPLPATYFVVTATSPQTVGAPFSFTVTAKDVNGGTVTGYTGAVHFTSTDVAASLPADYTFVGGDAGVHTFTNAATLNTTGGQTITATDTVTSSITGTSGTITVAPLPATYFVVTATSPQTVGAPFSFTVTAKDVNGGTVTGYTGTVHFTSTDVAASLPADYTFVGGDGGVRTFTNGVTLNTTGGQTITATDTVTSSITGTSGTITVNAAPKPPSPSPYAVPTITSLSPGAGKVGATVTLTGTSLSYARSVTFNGVPASFSVRTPSLIVATVPAGARTGPVRVTTPFGGATSARSFYVLP
jgi:hypothetical protein